MRLVFGQVQKLDLLALAPHPDDAEIGCGGTLARAVAAGQRVGILEMTLGELGSKGSVAERLAEAEAAASILRLTVRANLEWPDGFADADRSQRLALAQALRDFAPHTLLLPHPRDRHPDHTGTAAATQAALHLAGLHRAPLTGTPHKVRRVLQYQGNAPIEADVLIDVSPHLAVWEQAILAHHSQFSGPAISETVSPEVIERRKARMMYWGTFIGVRYAEAFCTLGPIEVGI
jgi:N-acetylglucosamine malate deacetylase 1